MLIDLIFLPPIAEVDDSYILQKGQPYRYPPHLAVPSLPIRNSSLSILNSSQTTPRVSSHRSRLLLVSSPRMSLDFSMFEVIRKPLTTSATYNKARRYVSQSNRNLSLPKHRGLSKETHAIWDYPDLPSSTILLKYVPTSTPTPVCLVT